MRYQGHLTGTWRVKELSVTVHPPIFLLGSRPSWPLFQRAGHPHSQGTERLRMACGSGVFSKYGLKKSGAPLSVPSVDHADQCRFRPAAPRFAGLVCVTAYSSFGAPDSAYFNPKRAKPTTSAAANVAPMRNGKSKFRLFRRIYRLILRVSDGCSAICRLIQSGSL